MDRVQAPKAILLIEEMTLRSVLKRVRIGEKGKSGGRRDPRLPFFGLVWGECYAACGCCQSRAALLAMQLPRGFGLLVTCICCATDVCLDGHDWMLEIAEAHSDGTLSIGHG